MPSTPELLIGLIVVVLLFGGSQLPKLAKNLGRARAEFTEGLTSATLPTTASDDSPHPTAN